MSHTFLNLGSCNGASGSASLGLIGDVVNGNRILKETTPLKPISYNEKNGLSCLGPHPETTHIRIRAPLMCFDLTDISQIEILGEMTPMFGVGVKWNYANAMPHLWFGDVNEYLTDVQGRLTGAQLASETEVKCRFAPRSNDQFETTTQIATPDITKVQTLFRLQIDKIEKKIRFKAWAKGGDEPTGYTETATKQLFNITNLLMSSETEMNYIWQAGRWRWLAVSTDGSTITVPVDYSKIDSFISGTISNIDDTPASNASVTVTDPVTGGVVGQTLTDTTGGFSCTLYGVPPGSDVTVTAADRSGAQQSATVANVKTIAVSTIQTQNYYQPIK